MQKSPSKLELLLSSVKAKKEKTLKNYEELKESLSQELDELIDDFYTKRDIIKETLSQKKILLKYKISVWNNFRKTRLKTLLWYALSSPFIYAMIIPAVILHFFLEVYHQIGFRIYKIPLVNYKEYFIFDRKLLPYLNWFEKFNCIYCSYFNSLIAYTSEISGRTERFWCPIKHARRVKHPHSQYKYFFEYGDAQNLRNEWKSLRKFSKEKKSL